jgi:signal transduction histidine kinase
MTDYKEGSKKDVAETKFLIHDLRVERFINEVIHFHVTLNTDLEIYSIEQAQILHGHDLQVLKTKAVSLRKAFQDYSNAVKNFSPDRAILRSGRNYIDTIRSICTLILNPLWGRVDNVLTFLPPDSRSSRSYDHYRNCIHWIAGVSRRIEHFLDEQRKEEVYEEFDIAAEIEEFTRNVIRGYVAEQSGATVELQLDRLDPTLIGGNCYRFRRMYFNLVMNAVDAMADRKPGTLNISDTIEGNRVVLRVRDNGVGMAPEKIQQLLTDKETLDGELHSLGFVFVRQTIAEFKGDLSIESKVDAGTTVTVGFPRLEGTQASPDVPPDGEKHGRASDTGGTSQETSEIPPEPKGASRRPAGSTEDKNNSCGHMIYEDYQGSEAQFPGCLFAISVTEDETIDFFTHRPYDRYWNMNHEDLSPMYCEATVRGRLEEDDLKRPLLILKEPQVVKEYFEFKNVPEEERSPERHVQMVHDEYVRIARKLIATGVSAEIGVELTGLRRFFPGQHEMSDAEPFPLRLLAQQPLTGENHH